jgi:hypothetical protein
MGQTHHPQLNRQAYEWATLIRKLRWIGMEDDAHQLQLAMCGLPPHGRARCARPLAGSKQTWVFERNRFRGRYRGKADIAFCKVKRSRPVASKGSARIRARRMDPCASFQSCTDGLR